MFKVNENYLKLPGSYLFSKFRYVTVYGYGNLHVSTPSYYRVKTDEGSQRF